MKSLLEYLLSKIVTHPEKISVSEEKQDQLLNFLITADPEDIKIIIGKNGRTIKAIRNLLQIANRQSTSRINLQIKE